MSLSGVVFRYFIAYVVLAFALGLGFNLLGIQAHSGVNIGILVGAVLWPCMAFTQKNGRAFTRGEKWRVIGGMVVIDLAMQLLFILGAMADRNGMTVGLLVASLAFAGLLHAACIWFFVGFAGRMWAKQRQLAERKELEAKGMDKA